MLKKLESIKKNLSNSAFIDNSYIIYSLIVLTYQILYILIPFRQMLEKLHLSFISPLLAVIGFFLFAFDVLLKRNFLRTKYSYFLLLLVGVMIISSLLNARYNLVESAKVIIWQISQMLVIFPIFYRASVTNFKKCFKIYFFVLSVIFVIASIVSLAQYFLLINYEVPYQGGLIRQGFSEGRLFGIFSTPHFASVFMSILIALSIYALVKAKRKTVKWFYAIASFIYFLYVVASGTRSVLVATAVTAAVVGFIWSHNNFSFKRKKPTALLKSVISVCLSLCLALGTVFVFNITDKALKGIVNLRYNSIVNTENPNEQESPESIVELNRTDVDISNISNHRFEIWSNYISVVSKSAKSLLVGLSPGGYMINIKENHSDLFIVEYIKAYYPRMDAKNLIYDTHNAYIGALATTGVLGLVLLLSFLVLGFIRTLKFIKQSQKIPNMLYVVLSLIVFLLVASFFDSDLFFKTTTTSIIFWLSTGLLLKITEKQ